MKPAASGSTLHALLVGVDRYTDADMEDILFEDLAGCVRDVGRVEGWLRQNLDVPPERIHKLLAPIDAPPEAVGPVAAPSYENLVAAFRGLRQQARPGDQVWIHFSGHGGRVATAFPHLKPLGVDEALVPADIAAEGRYLRDVELAYLLEELVDADLVVTLVLDCCHAGGALRRRRGHPRCRGTERIDASQPLRSLVASPEVLEQTWRRLRARATRLPRTDDGRSLRGQSGWLPEPLSYVLLAACRAHEQALEDFYDGMHPGGALTHFLLEALERLPLGESTFHDLHERIRAHAMDRTFGQTPQIEGDARRLVLGQRRLCPRGDTLPPEPAVSVLAVDAGRKRVLLATGEAQGTRRGARYAVFPPAWKELENGAGRVATAEIVECGATESWAVATAPPSREIELGAPAVLVEQGPVDQGGIRFHHSLGEGEREELRRAIEDDGFLEVVTEPEVSSDFEVAARRCDYVIFSADGRPMAGVETVPMAMPGAAGRVSWNLIHLARFRDVLELANADLTSPLQHGLRLKVRRRVDGTLEIHVANISDQVLNVTLLHLTFADWRIEQIFPRDGADFRSFEPEEKRDLELEPTPTSRAADEVIKAFGTVRGASFRPLSLPPIDSSRRRMHTSFELAGWDWTVAHARVRARDQ